jgi:superoxide dismutase, Fe-Mn family
MTSQFNGLFSQDNGSDRVSPLKKSTFMDKLSLYQTAHTKYPYTLPPLGYSCDALEPHIDAQTMHLHHDKHHQAYIDRANETIVKYPELQKLDLVTLLAGLSELPADIRTPLRSNGGGHLNHALFWEYLSPLGGGEPKGKLAQAITKTFGGFASFKEQFEAAAKTRSGSGWAWLSVTIKGDLETSSTANQDTPIFNGQLPILALDVWEHAYYLKYHNRRPEYVTKWWQVVNWRKVEEQFDGIAG